MVSPNDDTETLNALEAALLVEYPEDRFVGKEKMAQQDGLAELFIQVDHPPFRFAVVGKILGQVVPVLIEVDEPHLEEGQAQNLVVTGGVAKDVGGQVGFDFRAGQLRLGDLPRSQLVQPVDRRALPLLFRDSDVEYGPIVLLRPWLTR